MKREFLMLAHTLGEENIIGWLGSRKYDGMRAFWDGGVSRGLLCSEVPFANIEKDGRYKEPPRATGLWSRQGKAIQAPSYWLDKLPTYCLDGELMHPNGREHTLSIVKDISPGSGWGKVDYFVFDCPHPEIILAPGELFNRPVTYSWWYSRGIGSLFGTYGDKYQATYQAMKEQEWGDNITIISQTKITSWGHFRLLSEQFLEEKFEGIIVRHPLSEWIGGRSRLLLKKKPFLDMEAIVIGYEMGEGKYEGILGALICGDFKVGSGFTDSERADYLVTFPIGTKITIKYGRLGANNNPIEPRYWRKGN